MGKVTQAFVIAACSVAIATGGAYLYEKHSAHKEYEDCINRNVATFNSQLSGKQDNWNALNPNEKRDYWHKPCAEDPKYEYPY